MNLPKNTINTCKPSLLHNLHVNLLSKAIRFGIAGMAIATVPIDLAQAQSFPAIIELDQLNTSGSALGITIDGANESENSGVNINGACDFNGDGIDDVLISLTPQITSNNPIPRNGFIVYGPLNSGESVDLSTLNQAQSAGGLVIQGSDNGLRRNTLDCAGDINGDGIEDIIIGSSDQRVSNYNPYEGVSYLIYGTTEPPELIELSNFPSDSGSIINGEENNSKLGYSVSSAGDINGDGYDDLLLGAFLGNQGPNFSTTGRAYLIFGNDVLPPIINLNMLNQSGSANGTVFNGINRSDNAGRSVSAAGDVNDDGIDDILIGANFATNQNGIVGGQAYIVFGSDQIPPLVELSMLNQLAGINGVVINSITSGDNLSNSSTAGDFNNDGIDDIVIGALRADPNGLINAGETYLIFGTNNLPDSINLDELNQPGSATGIKINGVGQRSYSGFAVSSAGDFNGDGISDIIIGAGNAELNNSQGAGESYIIFGDTSLNGVIELSRLNQPRGECNPNCVSALI